VLAAFVLVFMATTTATAFAEVDYGTPPDVMEEKKMILDAHRRYYAWQQAWDANFGVQVCPVDGEHQFINSWGARRSGGRRHRGTDLMAEYGVPLVALENGTVHLGENRLGGITINLDGVGGDRFYYAHMQEYAEDLRDGQRVIAGELLGFVGSSGNAQVSHLHFGQYKSGRAVNPYHSLTRLCSDV